MHLAERVRRGRQTKTHKGDWAMSDIDINLSLVAEIVTYRIMSCNQLNHLQCLDQ